MTQFDKDYSRSLRQILDQGTEELNIRTGHRTKSIPGLHFVIDEGFPLLTLRRIPTKVFVAEQVWFQTGSRKPSEFLNTFTRIWSDFTNINGVITTAYGYRWRHHFGRDQIIELIKLLENDTSSRHGVVVAWDPASDGLNPENRKKNVPCPFAFTVNVIGGKLHLHNMVRSNDMILGFPHDVAGFAMLQRMLAAKLGLAVGRYSHSISNAHIYDVHYEVARQLLAREGQATEIQLEANPDWLDRAQAGDETLVPEIVGILEQQYQTAQTIGAIELVV